MDLNLAGKKALIGGASAGIGKATAQELARLGASVTLLARSEEKLKRITNELQRQGQQQHHYCLVDYEDPVVLENKVSAHLRQHGPVHILVNNTGGPPPGPAHLAEEEEYLSAFRQHLIVNQVLVRLCREGMTQAGYGRIVNVISTSVKAPLPNLGVSNTVRGAVANWAKTLATELGPQGITVNNVLPGATETERLEGIIANKAQKTGVDKKTAAQQMTEQIPLRRFAKPEELAQAIAFLASPAAAYISGINVPVDGGRTPVL
jgi:3-oxoacyl-[acyl-carrier protein] reductase